VNLERIYTFNLSEAYKKPRGKRGRFAIALLKKAISRHTKTKNVKIENALSNYLIKNYKLPRRKIKVKVTFDEKGAFATLAE
jgi:ribosomal protein L31E